MNKYVSGNTVKIKATIRNEAGALADPGAVTVKLRSPSEVVTTFVAPSVVQESTGVYTFQQQYSEEGQWEYRVTGTSPVIFAAEGQFWVYPSPFVT